MKTNYRYLSILLQFVLLFFWPTAVFSAVTILDSLKGHTLAVFLVLLFISTLAGLSALAIRIDKELRETGKPMANPWLFVSSHMLASWVGGMFAFFLSEGLDLSDWNELLVVLAFSFGGVKALEAGVTHFLSKYLPVIPPPPPPPSN